MACPKTLTNSLINEKSPYLLQHAHNPIDWYPWGDKAFSAAKSQGKLIFLSIGYSTCHWCHVMERESFEDDEVAEILNRDFISIKVDREERPDIDAVYMNVCQALIGSGGWPLTIVMTPEQKPIFAGTYFPKKTRGGVSGLMGILDALQKSWASDRQKLIDSAEEIALAFQHFDRTVTGAEPSRYTIKQAYTAFSQSFDDVHGGFGTAPKFPTPHNLMFLMRYYVFEGEKRALDMVEKTLVQMYRGGIFDHVGGGFSRYSTDSRWLAPHFEKMLYDNALLSLAYIEAYKITSSPLYLRVAERTLQYISNEMTSPEGGFYSAQDADSDGVEGKYYLFTPEETKKYLGAEDGNFFNNFYDITDTGNFEGSNIPNLINNASYDKWNEKLQSITEALRSVRLKRYSLLKDDKILTSWNSLMITAFSNAYMATGIKEYLLTAEKSHDFIIGKLTDENRYLKVRYREGESTGNGFLDDYAFFILALISLYDSTYDVRYLNSAVHYCRRMISLFHDDEKSGFFLYSNDGESLIFRPKETYDGAMPSGNSVAGYVLSRLGAMTEAQDITEISKRQSAFLESSASQYPHGFSFSLISQMQEHYNTARLICVLPNNHDVPQLALSLGKGFSPNLTVLIKTPENSDALVDIAAYTKDYPVDSDRAAFYLCMNKTCYPVEYDFNKITEKLRRINDRNQ